MNLSTEIPMPKSAGPVTEASIQAAREDCARERRRLGLNPDPDAPAFEIRPLSLARACEPRTHRITAVCLPVMTNPRTVDERSSLAVQVDALVRQHGLSAVKLAVRYLEEAGE